MHDEILKRIEAKVDILIGLLLDRILTEEEIALLKGTDEIIQRKCVTELVRL